MRVKKLLATNEMIVVYIIACLSAVIALVNPVGSCEVSLYGAHVLGYRPMGHAPVLFISKESLFEPGKPIRWEAETGRLVPFFAVGEDQRASGGKFVWLPGEPGQPGGADLGSVSWNIRLTSGGGYQLRGRVKSPTSSDDSFRLRLLAAGGGMPAPVDWSVGIHNEWTWVWFNDPATRKPKVFDLATGATTIEILPRENGTCIDQLELVPIR